MNGRPFSPGNMTLWLKGRGLYDRKSTESSNMVFLQSPHSAPHPHFPIVTL